MNQEIGAAFKVFNQSPYHFYLEIACSPSSKLRAARHYCNCEGNWDASGGGGNCRSNITEGETVKYLKGNLQKKHAKKGNESYDIRELNYGFSSFSVSPPCRKF